MTLDPVTFEVIRHRLWAINDDQAMIAARLSGSPVVYEALDFNAALMTGDGRGLYAGIYIIQHASTIDVFVQKVLEVQAEEQMLAAGAYDDIPDEEPVATTPQEWDERKLCPDGACTGVIGPDGTCHVCKRSAAQITG